MVVTSGQTGAASTTLIEEYEIVLRGFVTDPALGIEDTLLLPCEQAASENAAAQVANNLKDIGTSPPS
jgi:hypothetical protein